jgi:hypothetical protein
VDKILKNIYFLFILISSGLATEFYRSQIGIIFTFLLTIAMWAYFKIPITRKYGVAIVVWALYSIATFFQHQVFTPFFIFRYATYITVAYVMVMLYKERLFIRFEKYLTTLALISLFFFVWQVLSKDTLLAFARIFDVSGEMGRNSHEFRNFIFHTVEVSLYDTSYERNYGFAFEPGTYSVYLAIAILFNLLRTHLNFSPKGNVQFYILTLALITTFSTTGYIALGIIIIYLIFIEVKGVSKYFYLLVSLIVAVYIFLSVDFLYNKVEELYLKGQEIDTVLERAEETGTSYSGGRFGGFIIGWEDFKQFPLWGRGGVSNLTSGSKGDGRVYMVNGIATIMSRFGVFGLIIYFSFLYKSSKILSRSYKSNAIYVFFLACVVGNTSFSIHEQYLLFALIFMSFFYNIQNESKNNLLNVSR